MILGYAFTAILYAIVVAVTTWYKPVMPDVPAQVAENNAPDAQVDFSDTDFGPASGHSLLPDNERQQEQQSLSSTPSTSASSTTSSTAAGRPGLTSTGLPVIVEPEAPPPAESLQGRRKSRFMPSIDEGQMLGLQFPKLIRAKCNIRVRYSYMYGINMRLSLGSQPIMQNVFWEVLNIFITHNYYLLPKTCRFINTPSS